MKLTKNKFLRAGRWMGRWVMGVGLIAMALACGANGQAVSTTTVQGTVYLANGQPGAGTLVVSWPAFTTANNQAVAAGRTTVTIAPDGFVSVNLAPNLGATPAGLYYTAVYYMSDGTTNTEYWVVPVAAQATLGQVRAQVMPAAQAVQAVSKAYVDQAIAEATQSQLSPSGGTLSGPLYLSGDPTQALQAADKHYVDTEVQTAVPLAGGSMTGALATPTVNGVQAPSPGSTQTTLQAAVNAAGTNGAMEIPPTYAGTDTFTNPAGVRVTDLRTAGAQQAARSVKEFGAVCDGVTDDTNALQAALNYANAHGVALTIPQGTCKTHTLVWHGESMGGMGKQVSALMGFPGQDVLATAADSANLLSYTHLHDLTIYVDQSVDVSCSPAKGRAAAGSCAVNRPVENNSIFSPGGNGLTGVAGSGAGWSVGNCAIAMPATTGAGGNGLRVAEIENVEIAATGVDPLAQYAGAHSTHTCGMYLAQWPQWSEFRNIDMRGLNTGIAMPALPGTTPVGLNADSNRWQDITIQATHAFVAAAGSNDVLDNVVAQAGNSAATGEAPTGLILDLTGTEQGWTVRNAVVLPTWDAVQPQLAVTAAGGAVTAVAVGSEHGLGFDPYGTQVPVAFGGACTAQATASVNSDGSIGGVTVTQGGTGCSSTTTASVNVAGTWDTAAPVNLIGGRNVALFGGNLLKGNGGYTVWNATGSESYGTQMGGGGGTLPGGGLYAGLVAQSAPGSTSAVDQFPGADFGAKLQACLNSLSAASGGTCDARNFSGTLSMGSNLEIATANATVLLPCATIATADQIVVTAGTRNVSLRGCALRGTSGASGSQGGTVFLYSGTGAMVEVGDPAYAVDTAGFHMDNVAINTTQATSGTAQGLAAYRTQEMDLESLYLLGNQNQTGMTLDGTGNYTGGTFYDDQFTGFQTAVNAVGHQVANPATTDWLNASTFVRLHIDCPTSGGNPISGTYGINLQQGDGNTFTGGDVEGCSTALHLGPNAQNNTMVGLRNENSTNQVVADAGSAYNNWMTGGTMFTGKLTDNGTRNSFLDTFHRSFNGLNGDWYGSQQDATITNHYRLGTGAGNERGLLNRYQTDSGYRWTTGLSDATAGEQFYQILDELNNVYRVSIGQYNPGQASTNNQTVINAAGTGAIVLNGSNSAGTGGVVFGSGGSSETTVATINNAGNAQFNGTLQVGGTSTFGGTPTVKNQADAEIDATLWAGLTAPQKESFIYKDWNGNSQWYMVKDASNNWALNSAPGGLDSFKAYQSTNSGDTYIDASNPSGVVRVNYETGSGAGFNIYGGNSSALYASFTGTNAIKFPGLAASSGSNCLQVDDSGYISNTGSPCGTGSGGGSGTVGSGSTGQIAYYTGNGTTVGGISSVPLTSGGTGASTAAQALANLGAVPAAGGTMTGGLTAPQFNGPLSGNATTATALAAAPGQCAAGQYTTGVTANGTANCAAVSYTQLSGTAPTWNQNTTGTSAGFTGSLSGDVTGAQSSTTVVKVNGASLPTSAALTGTNSSGQITAVSTLPASAEPVHTGDVTNTGGSLAMTVKGVNGTALSGLATGLLKNTTGTGEPSIAVAGTDYVTPSGSITGTASNVTGTVQLANGGTGAATAAGALANLGGWMTPLFSSTAPSGSCAPNNQVEYVTGSGTPYPQYTCASGTWAQTGGGNGGSSSYPGVAGNGANGLTVQGVVSPSTVQPSSGPVLDIRNPAFAGGAVCDGTTDIEPALQAAVNALSAAGGVIQIVGTYTSPCYISNPNLITWQGNTITLQISGVLETGATFSLPSNVQVSLAGKGGYASGSFQMSGYPAQLTLVNTPGAQTGTLGTAVSTTPGTGDTVTFTPPGGIGALVAGDAITVAGVLQCSISTISTTSNVVTATMTGACHIPPGIKDFVVAGVTDSSFDGTFALLTSDYNTNTMTWDQTGSNRSSSGGTVTGLNVDTVETVPVTSCTSTTCTATFNRSHTANDVWGVATAALNKSNQNLTDMAITNNYGSPLVSFMTAYHPLIRNTFLGGLLPVSFDATSYPVFDKDAIFVAPSATNPTTMPWSIRFWNHNWTSLTGYSGMITIEDSFINSEIQMDYGAEGLYLHNVVNETPLAAMVVYDTTYKTTNSGIPSVITIERSQFQDTSYITPVWVYYPYSGTVLGEQTAVTLRDNTAMSSNPFVNDYFDGQILASGNGPTPGSYGNTLVQGVEGVYIDGKKMIGEFAGEGSSMGPSAIPYATANINQNPTGWSGTNCTVTPGGIAPDGSASSMVGVITSSGGCYASVGATGTMTPAVGDRILWGGWVYSPTPGVGTSSNGGYNITSNGSTHFYMNGAQSVSTAQWDSGIPNNGWHVVVGMATVTSSDGTGSQRVYLTANNSNSADTFEYWMPFLIYIPASANIPLAEINRWRAQLLHGAVPSNYSGPGIPATAEPIATGGYYALNPSGGAPNLLLPGALTGYSTDGGAGTGDTVAVAKGRFTQSTLPVCPNGTSGELTTSGCSSGLSGMTAGQVPIAATASTVTSSMAVAGAGAGIVTGPKTSTPNDCVKYADAYGTIADAGAACGSGGGSGATTYDFTTTTYPSGLGCSGSGGSYTCTAFPTTGHMCTVTVVQGGSGGGSGATCTSSSTCYGGGGGAGGLTQQMTVPCSVFGSGSTATVTVTVGSGGTGGAANAGTSASGNAGTMGGLSSIAGASGYMNITAPSLSGTYGSGGTTSSGTGGTDSAVTNTPGCNGSNGSSGTGGTQQCNVAADGAGGGAGGGGLASGTTAAGGPQYSGVQGYKGGGSISGYTGGTAGGGSGQTPYWSNAQTSFIYAAFGGTGGGSNCSGNGGTGGTGMTPGGGGAGGGAACNGYSSGAGGAGGPGWVRIIVQ